MKSKLTWMQKRKAGWAKAKGHAAAEAPPALDKSEWRVGQRNGQTRWQIKQAPGWRVAHEVDSLREAEAWLLNRDVDPATVPVLMGGGDWPMLAEAVKAGQHSTHDNQPIHLKQGDSGLHQSGAEAAQLSATVGRRARGQSVAAPDPAGRERSGPDQAEAEGDVAGGGGRGKAKRIEVEVVAPKPDEKALKALEKPLQKVLRAELRRRVDSTYDVVLAGLIYKKAALAFRCDSVAGAMRLSGGQLSTSDQLSEDGFYAWAAKQAGVPFDEKEDRQSFKNNAGRQIRRWMTACESVGLTTESPLEEVARLKDKHLLDDKRLSDLYRKDKGDSIPPEPEAARDLAAEAARALSEALDSALALKEQTPPELYEANILALRETLERYTDSAWGQISDADAAAREAGHGEVTAEHQIIQRWKSKKARGRK